MSALLHVDADIPILCAQCIGVRTRPRWCVKHGDAILGRRAHDAPPAERILTHTAQRLYDFLAAHVRVVGVVV
jgi:hypothetical protein